MKYFLLLINIFLINSMLAMPQRLQRFIAISSAHQDKRINCAPGSPNGLTAQELHELEFIRQEHQKALANFMQITMQSQEFRNRLTTISVDQRINPKQYEEQFNAIAFEFCPEWKQIQRESQLVIHK